jgi:hypothetical protein
MHAGMHQSALPLAHPAEHANQPPRPPQPPANQCGAPTGSRPDSFESSCISQHAGYWHTQPSARTFATAATPTTPVHPAKPSTRKPATPATPDTNPPASDMHTHVR